ncbi:MAG: hypothetical protein ACRCXB_31550 [Aeromonadaceae bacterium]
MKIGSRFLRAAINFQAIGDVRYYLNGVMISRKHVMATNGHIAVMMEHGARVRSEGVIIKFCHKIPAKAVTTKINLLGKNSYAEHIGSFGETISVGLIEVIKGRYPDVKSAVENAYKPRCGAEEKVAVQAKYLAVIEKAFGSKSKFCHISLLTRKSNESVGIDFHSEIVKAEFGNPMACIMPASI